MWGNAQALAEIMHHLQPLMNFRKTELFTKGSKDKPLSYSKFRRGPVFAMEEITGSKRQTEVVGDTRDYSCWNPQWKKDPDPKHRLSI